MKRPDFYAPGVDTERLQEQWMLKLEARLDIPCPGCPGCATGDCADALDVAAAQVAALAQANVRLEHVAGHDADTRRNAETIADHQRAALEMVRDELQDQDRWRAPELARGTLERVLANLKERGYA